MGELALLFTGKTKQNINRDLFFFKSVSCSMRVGNAH